MSKLNTHYLGLSLRSPIIASSSGLTDKAEKIKKLDQAGVGAVVLKSLFEEQILNQANVLAASETDPEAYDAIRGYIDAHEVENYLTLIRESKANSSVPIIASINCSVGGRWEEFAARIADAGADALELNIFFLPTDASKPSAEYERLYVETVQRIVGQCRIPVSVKLGKMFTNPLHVMQQLSFVGAKGCTLFNRFYEPDVNLESLKLISSDVFSTPHELHPTLRWVAMGASQLSRLDLGVSTGVHTADDAAKAILTGACVTQVCTALYKRGPEYVGELNRGLEAFMDRHGLEGVEAMRGQLGYGKGSGVEMFERSQFMVYFSSHS